MLHNTNANQYKSPHIPKVQNWKSITYIDDSAMDYEITKQKFLGAGIFTHTTDTGYSDTISINSGCSGPHSPSIELNLQLC
jgi:L,D-peptidoglycan transpeptidase YkuD (ErfK/YbiS/YcfS/YnhG family)